MIRRGSFRLGRFPPGVWVYALAAGVAWNLVVGASFVWNVRIAGERAREMSTESARVHLRKDRALRLWAASHGGVYVEVDSTTPPSPYLTQVRERDITTPSGRHLTLMDPVYMIRQVMEQYGDICGIHGHITSLKPVNPINAPDPWEHRGLVRLEAGDAEVLEVTQQRGGPALRLMRPLITISSCMPCHRHQGYKIGDVRGAIGVTVPLAPYLARADHTKRNLAVTHGVIWLLGIAGILVAAEYASRTVRQQQQAARELAASEQKYRIVADNTYDWEFWLDPKGRFLYCSPSCERMTGHGAEKFIDDPELLLRVVHPEDRARFEAYRARDLDLRRGEEIEVRVVRPDGEVRWHSHICQPVYDGEGAYLGERGSNRDITGRKSAEEALLQSARLVALGQMAAGMAHELNQPLTALSIMAEGMELTFESGRCPSEAQQRRWSRETLQLVSRMASSIEHLRLFSRERTHEPPVPAQLNEIVQSALQLTRAQLISHGIDVRTDLADDLWVLIEPYRMEQVLINLIINARDAVEERTGTHAEAPFVSIRAWSAQGWAHLDVSDNGDGIDASIRDRVFEPFATTKLSQRGTGLGLAIAHTVITDHDGEITFDSDTTGTVFHLRLPLHGVRGEGVREV